MRARRLPFPATGSRRRRPASSTSAGRARRCTTGRSPSRLGGTFVLRIEDTDEARNRPEWTQGIIDALAWIGISRRRPDVRGPVLPERLRRRPTSLPPTGCSSAARLLLRPDGASRSRSGPRRGAHRLRRVLARPRARAGARPRAAVPRARRARRSSTTSCAARSSSTTRRSRTSCCCAATARRCSCSPTSSTTSRWASRHVVRAEEHLPNTPKQQMLWEALGHEPPVWAHVPVLVNEQRKKLSKRRDKVALEQYRDEGYLADAMVNYLMTLGWAPQGDDRDRAVGADRGRVPAGGRHPLAGVLRPQEARRVQRRVHPRRCRSTSSSTRVRAVAAAVRGIAAVFAAIAPHIQERARHVRRGAGDGRLPVPRPTR